jgi:KDO2-lipid IV(A) lauroyltransferase
MRVLYVVADGGYALLYYVLKYRRAVVEENIREAFPARSEEEREAIVKKFYRSFADQWVETIKLLTITKREMNKRVSGNWEVFADLNDEGRNTYALLGHFFNWEWANVACAWNAPQTFAGVYLPVSSKAFDRLMYRLRSRSGSELISMKAQKSGFERLRGHVHIVGLIADQNPAVTDHSAWISFMHREAPFFKGPEAMSRRANGAVVFAAIRKVSRGYYQITLKKYCDEARDTEPGAITAAYVAFLEEGLEEQPENYLWSHRRWKHKRPL